MNDDLISRKMAIDAIIDHIREKFAQRDTPLNYISGLYKAEDIIEILPSAEPKQRYTEEELSVFAHGISLSLLSKRSSQRWRYDKDTATEIEFLERLYDKVSADMRGGQNE